jgi:uncharacterized delta-60 repeat protein
MRRTSALICSLAIAHGATSVAAAHVGPTELDRGFGHGGRVTAPASLRRPWSREPVRVAEGPGGEIVVAGAQRVNRYLADGEPDRSFGDDGAVTVALPGARRFTVADAAVDSEGRVTLIGTAVAARNTLAAVVRYDAQGRPDASFGADGVAMGGFGLRFGRGSGAVGVSARLGSIDEAGDIALVVGPDRSPSGCGGPARSGQRDLLVKLTARGAPDPRFARDGARRIGALESIASMALDGRGDIVLAGEAHRACDRSPAVGVIRLREDGSRDQGFGRHGTRIIAGSVAAIAVDSRDRIVVLCQARRLRPPRRNESAIKVLRLLPGGRLDPTFSGGRIVYFAQGPLYRWSTVLTDARDRPLLVGTVTRQLPERQRPRFHRWFAVVRLRRSGALQDHFGWQGWISITRFGHDSDTAASDALLDSEGRLLVAGTALQRQPAPNPELALGRFELAP